VRLQVSDLEQSVTFYTRMIGLRVISRDDTTATLGPHGDDTALVELHERKGARTVPKRGLLGLYHFAILLPDRASLGRFLQHLAELNAPAGMSDHLVSEAIYLQDPDNLGIEVYADRPRTSWQHQGRQLVMATEALDTRDLLAAGDGENWTGAPPGTRIGHIHLHVGDIAQADAFYHVALGFDKVVWSYAGALFMSAGGYHHHLGNNTWARGAPSASDEDAKLLDWELVLPDRSDVSAAEQSLRGARHNPRLVEHGFAVSDPWGTTVRLVAV
jgi:catechol 2,3-dioxygenase